jgi:hypothetical protein
MRLDAGPTVGTEEVLAHLDAVLSSSVFVSSRRCRAFLQYVVVEAVEGRGHLIKERNVALEVFGKGPSFEPNEDALVRVKAREVRKRLLDYYNQTPESSIRIDLPLGGYAPHIHSNSQTVAPVGQRMAAPVPAAGASPVGDLHPVADQISRRRLGWMLGGSAAMLGAGSLAAFHHSAKPLDLLWRPIFSTKSALLICIPVLYDADGQLSVKIGIGPATALSSAVNFLTKRGYPYDLRFGSDLTFPQMQKQPTLILGGFASDWTMRITRDLSFNLTWDADKKKIIRDTRTGQVWRPANLTQEGYADQDYGILCRLFDAESGQIVMIAAGITTFGTAGAASVLFDANVLSELLKQAPKNWETRNMEAIVRVPVIGMTASSPQIVATHFW